MRLTPSSQHELKGVAKPRLKNRPRSWVPSKLSLSSLKRIEMVSGGEIFGLKFEETQKVADDLLHVLVVGLAEFLGST